MPNLLSLKRGQLVFEFAAEGKPHHFFEIKEFKEGKVLARQYWPELIEYLDITEREVQIIEDPRHAFFLGMIAAHKDFQSREKNLQNTLLEYNKEFHQQYMNSVGLARLKWNSDILSLMHENLKIAPTVKDE